MTTAPRFPFPDRPRLWGVAVSHYQVEGNDECDWTEWERSGRTRGERCGDAVSSWQLYEEDVDLAGMAGANSFRFSISWSRVEPRPGEFDDAALARYRRLAEHCLTRGIEPAVTLFHYTHPLWFHELTPWTSPRSVEAFARFTRRVVQSLGSSVRMYTLINEPLVFLLAGYIDAQIPPGISDASSARKALTNLLHAHAAAAAIVRELQPDAAIGIAHNMMAFAPLRPLNPLDRLLARAAHQFYNEALWQAFATGRWSFLLPPSTLFRGRCDELVGSLDFAGVNFYSRLHLRFPGRVRWIGEFSYLDRSGWGLTDNGWEIVPDALGTMIDRASQLGLPVVITENGLADGGDGLRPRFIEAHLQAIAAAESRGIAVPGYFHWSLLDNYEWLDGFGPKFGLYSVDREMRRTPRRSVCSFKQAGTRFLARGHAEITA